MIHVFIKVNGAEEAKQFVSDFSSGITSEEASEVVSEAAAERIRDHFKLLHDLRHRANMPRSYYLRAQDSVVATFKGNEGQITIDHTGLALRYYGGSVGPSGRVSRITGKPIKRLAIPVAGGPGEGKDPYEFKGALKLIITKRKKAFLALADDEDASPVYWLVKQAVHKADPGVLPEDVQISDYAEDALDELIREKAK